MPGVLALVDFEARSDLKPRFERMRAACKLAPGYLSEGVVAPGGVAALGRADLATFNPEPQPLRSHDGRFTLVMQGEVRDRAARLAALAQRSVPLTGQGNADMLLATFVADGPAGIERLNGSFFFVLWDAEARALWAGSDRHASRPHLYTFHQGRFLIAPDVAGLVAGRGETPGLDERGLSELLALEYPLADRTPFAGFKAFPGGTFLRLDAEGAHWKRYWAPRYVGGAEARVRLADFLDEAVDRYGRAVARALEGPVVVPLSGGSDSRTIVALAGDRRFPTFTFGTESSEDVRYARAVARAAGLEHHFVPLRADYMAHHADRLLRWGDGMVSLFHAHDCDGLEEARAIAPVAVYGMTAEYCRLEAVDNLLAEVGHGPLARVALLARHVIGGRQPQAAFADEAALVDRLVGRAWCALTPDLADTLLTPEFAAVMRESVRAGLAESLVALEGATLEDRLATWNVTQRQRRFTQWGLKVAGAVQEFRKPFDDYELVDFLLTVPAATRRKLVTAVICQASPALASLPRTGSGVALNASFPERAAAYARKRLNAWLRPARVQSFGDPQAALREHAGALFEELFATSLPTALVRPEAARALLARHLAGEVNAASALCALATLAMVQRGYAPVGRPAAA